MKKIKKMLSEMFYYIQGNIRYSLYYSEYKYLIPEHIKEQIDLRIKIMDKDCLKNGSCKLCGCKTTALQMANKPCDKPCYPPMLNCSQWRDFNDYIGNTLPTRKREIVVKKMYKALIDNKQFLETRHFLGISIRHNLLDIMRRKNGIY